MKCTEVRREKHCYAVKRSNSRGRESSEGETLLSSEGEAILFHEGRL